MEPNPNDGSIKDPLLNLACLDSSLAMKSVFQRFKSVILTSGTMSPMGLIIIKYNIYSILNYLNRNVS